MQNALTSGCIFSLNCSNYLPNIVAACPHCTLGTELCTAYVTMHHVPFLSQAIHTSIHSSCHSSQRTWPSGICSCSLGMSSSNRFSQMLLHPIFLPQLLSGWYHQWYWVALAQRFKTLTWYSTKKKRFKQASAYIVYLKTSKSECTDMPHAIEHIKSLPHILHISSIWILDAFP